MKKLLLISILGTGLYGGAFGSEKPVVDEAHYEDYLSPEAWGEWHQFIQTGDLGAVERLLQQHNVPVNAQIFGNTILDIAAQFGYLGVVQYLVNTDGINIYMRNGAGLTPFDLARQNGYLDIAEILKGKEANDLAQLKRNVDTQNKDGKTPLYIMGINSSFEQFGTTFTKTCPPRFSSPKTGVFPAAPRPLLPRMRRAPK